MPRLKSMLAGIANHVLADMQHRALIAYQHLSYAPAALPPRCDAFQLLMVELARARRP